MLQEHPPLADVQRGRHLLLARALAGLTLAGFAIGLVFTFLDASIRPSGSGDSLGDLGFVLAFAMFPVIGYLLASRRPENSIGWLMQGIGVFFGVTAIVSELGGYLIHSGRPDAGLVLIAIDQPSWLPIVVLPVTFLLLLFPDGHLPSPRWRWFAWGLGIGLTVVYFAILLDPAPMLESPVPDGAEPDRHRAAPSALDAAQALILVIPIGAIASLTALVLRFRRSSGVERLQLRWLLTAAAFVALLYSAAMFASLGASWGGGDGDPSWLVWAQNLVILSFVLIPIAIGVSILRYRLFDIDVVINKAVLFGALAVFITLVYVAIVVGVGALVGSQASPVLSAAAAATVAPRVPAAPAASATIGRPARLREARDAVRGAVGVLRAGRADLRERGAAPEDGARAGGGHRGGESRCVGARRGGAPSRRRRGPRTPRRRRRERCPRRRNASRRPPPLRAGPSSGRAARRALDREAPGRVSDGDRGEARPRPGGAGRARDAQRRAD